MQKLISKYGLAAHLAILAVAPLTLFPFVAAEYIFEAVLWLSLLNVGWIVSSPSKISGETSYDARRRVFGGMLKDPLTWALITVVAVAFVGYLNGGIHLQYDAEVRTWAMSEPTFPILPGSSGNAGLALLASSIAFALVTISVKHAIARASRGAFAVMIGILSSLAAAIMIYELAIGNEVVLRAFECSPVSPDYIGMSFAIVFLIQVVALPIVFERGWLLAALIAPFSMGTVLLAALLFAPIYVSIAVAIAALPLIGYSIFWGIKRLPKSGGLRSAVVLATGIGMSFFFAFAFVPGKGLSKLSKLSSEGIVSTQESELKDHLNELAADIWGKTIWKGSGEGTLPLEMRLNHDIDWKALDVNQKTAVSAFWHVLAERGVIGAAAIIIPLLFLLIAYADRIRMAQKALPIPLAVVGPVILVLALASMFFNCWILRSESMTLIGSLMAISANSFVKEKKNG